MTHITTHSGRQFHFEQPEFNLYDISSALARIQRFNGHTSAPWSVAQHSLACAALVAPVFCREALLHDACEAYLCDIPTPLKSLLPDYQALERRIERLMREHFGLPPSLSPQVKAADYDMLVAEAYVFHPELWKEFHGAITNQTALQIIETLRSRDPMSITRLFDIEAKRTSVAFAE